MPDREQYKQRVIDGQFEIVETPKELKETGYLGVLAILDTKNRIAYAVNASNMAWLMNGYNHMVYGVKVK